VATLVTLVSDDASFTMPPFPLWLRGPEDIGKWYVGQGAACEGSRLVPLHVNGTAGFAAYKAAGDGSWHPFAIQVVEASGGRLVGLHHFLDLDRTLFAAFGLPPVLTAETLAEAVTEAAEGE